MMLGKKLAAYRKQKGLTQQQLGEYLNVSAQAVSKWENDQAEPDLSTVSKLAALYQISVDSLLTGKDFEVLDTSQPTQQAEEEIPAQAAKEEAPVQATVHEAPRCEIAQKKEIRVKQVKAPPRILQFLQKHKLPILLAALAVLIAVSLLIAFLCGAFDRSKPSNTLDTDNPPSSQTDPSPSNPAPDPDPDPDPNPPSTSVLNLITDGSTDYVIVRDYQASTEIVSAVQELATSIKNNIGADVTIKECFNNREESSDIKADKEILIGMTNREESINALDDMRSKDYTICANGSKLIIGGGGDVGTLAAITRFIQDFVIEQGDSDAVEQGIKQSLSFSVNQTVNEIGSYSYTSAHIMGVNLDKFGIIYPNSNEDCEAFANELSTHISVQSGYELAIYHDATTWCDYEIRIGNATQNNDHHNPADGCMCNSLASNEYYIKLVKTQVTYEDGSTHDGARLYICFGASARNAAMDAFTKQIMPALKEAASFKMDEGFELTNRTA